MRHSQKFFFTIWLVLLCFSYTDQFQKLNVTVYYETLCHCSANFITQNISTVWTQLKGYINFNLVPYGNAQQEKLKDGDWNFTCQHGPNECLGNEIQSCGLYFLRKDQNKQIRFAACFMSHNVYPFNLKCFKDHKLKKKFSSCINSKVGKELMAKNGNSTHSLSPPLKKLPSISFNGIHNLTLEEEAKIDLLGTICKLLTEKPPTCTSQQLTKKSKEAIINGIQNLGVSIYEVLIIVFFMEHI